MKRLLSLTALGSLLTALFFVAVEPARAGDVDQRIQALEQELAQLKSEQAQLKGEQMELRKEATAAGAKLPTFSYRRGSGLRIRAADKSWQYTVHTRSHVWLLFRDGQARERGGQGEVFARRMRLHHYFCVDNCLYEFEIAFDMDGFGQDSSGTNSQREQVTIHLEKVSPWLPSFWFGKDVSNDFIRRRSSSNDAQLDYDILTRSLYNTGSIGNGMGIGWEDIPLSGLGIPGQIGWFTVTRGNLKPSDGTGAFTDKTDYTVSLGVTPFNKTKSKWLKGLELSWAAFLGAADPNADTQECDRFRLRETDGPERADVWEGRNTYADGRQKHCHLVATALRWRVGPYQLRTMGAWARMNKAEGNVHEKDWEISHQLFLWSPKGFLTGSSSRSGTVMMGYTFNRADGYCKAVACRNSGEYNNNHVILNQLALWYILARRTAFGVVWNHYMAPSVETSVQEDLECRNNPTEGKGCKWDNVYVVFRYEF